MKSSDITYGELIARMYADHPSVQNAGFSAGAFKPGLDAMRSLAARMGNPEHRFRSIHVAGTNGKGSVCSMLAASLSACGYRVGLYTSPHLTDFRERIKIIDSTGGGKSFEMIPETAVRDFLERYDDKSLSFFEVTTGMAFHWFAQMEVDMAVIEVGLGGRLDSTNIIEPELSVITSIGLDHCAILGSTRAAIAREKAGIFKTGVPALVAYRDDETGPVFEETAQAVHCPLFYADDLIPETAGTSGFDLEGPCQEINVRTVLAALELSGLEADMDVLARTAAITGFRGRWERLLDSPETICDIGHNPPALEINFRKLSASGRPLVIVYGIMADKDLDGIAPLMPGKAEYFLAAPSTERSLDVSSLHARLAGLRPDLSLHEASSVGEAVNMALETAAGLENPLVYIGGSTFVVAEAVSEPIFQTKHNCTTAEF